MERAVADCASPPVSHCMAHAARTLGPPCHLLWAALLGCLAHGKGGVGTWLPATWSAAKIAAYSRSSSGLSPRRRTSPRNPSPQPPADDIVGGVLLGLTSSPRCVLQLPIRATVQVSVLGSTSSALTLCTSWIFAILLHLWMLTSLLIHAQFRHCTRQPSFVPPRYLSSLYTSNLNFAVNKVRLLRSRSLHWNATSGPRDFYICVTHQTWSPPFIVLSYDLQMKQPLHQIDRTQLHQLLGVHCSRLSPQQNTRDDTTQR